MSALPNPERRLLLAGLMVGVVTLAILTATRLVLSWPYPRSVVLLFGCVPVLIAAASSADRRARQSADSILVHSVGTGAALAVTTSTFLVIVVGLGRMPEDGERSLILLALVGAGAGVLIFEPVRRTLTSRARQRLTGSHDDRDAVLKVFGQRIRRDIPLEEVLLQSAETLRRSMGLDGSEIWTGREGRLERTASVPERPSRVLALDTEATQVAARAGVVGPAWLRIWMPELVARPAGDADGTSRVGSAPAGSDGRGTSGGRRTGLAEVHQRAVPLGFAGDLLGMVLVERIGRDFSAQEEEVLAELGRLMGLALHNTQLDLALQDTLDEVRRQAGEIQASRRRLVQTADDQRRRIERDLHDGAQQHLVALSVNLRLARDMVADDPDAAVEMLDGLHVMVKDAVQEFRNLAHGIYPPLLAESGLPAALRAAAARSPLTVTVETDLTARFTPDIEAAVYFCCLEALQNASKHAAGADVAIRIWTEAGGLLFEVIDDGPGFDVGAMAGGQGFVNMADRLGAIGGTVRLDAAPGRGTQVTGALPATAVSP